jgi:hypothetical protein
VFGHVAVELADVCAVELDHIDVDERDVLAELDDAVARGEAELLEVVGELAGEERAAEREAAAVGDLPQLVEQGVEDGFLVREVVVEVSGGDAGPLGDVAHARGAVAVAREKLQSNVEHLPPASFRLLFPLHGAAKANSTLRL